MAMIPYSSQEVHNAYRRHEIIFVAPESYVYLILISCLGATHVVDACALGHTLAALGTAAARCRRRTERLFGR